MGSLRGLHDCEELVLNHCDDLTSLRTLSATYTSTSTAAAATAASVAIDMPAAAAAMPRTSGADGLNVES